MKSLMQLVYRASEPLTSTLEMTALHLRRRMGEETPCVLVLGEQEAVD